jgi:3-oxoacyl-[acyl-carrier-protein] synthase-3
LLINTSRLECIKNILVIGSEVHSTGFRYDEVAAVVFGNFGDGAGAAVLSREEDTKGILSTHLHSEGQHAEELLHCTRNGSKVDTDITTTNDEIFYSYERIVCI